MKKETNRSIRTSNTNETDCYKLRSPIGLTFINGLAISLVCTPFDVIKNYWIFRSSDNLFKNELLNKKDLKIINSNTIQIIKELYNYNGLRTFWTGLVPSMLCNIPSNIVFFNFYNYFLNILNLSPGLSGIQARIISTLLVAPMEFIRTRSQAQIGNELFADINQNISKLKINRLLTIKSIKNYRIRHLWSGLWITILRDVPFTAIYWTLTEKLRRKYIIEDNFQRNNNDSNIRNLPFKLFSIATISGTTATILSHPLDIIKTNIQTHNFNMRYSGSKPVPIKIIVSNIFNKKSIRSFYTGIFPRILKIVPSCAISLALFELCRKK